MQSEDGPWEGDTVSYPDTTNRLRQGLSLQQPNATAWSQSYTYDSASRLTNVSDGTYNAGYFYHANSPLVSQISFRSNSTVRMTTAKQYDYLNRLMSISSAGSGASASPVSSTYLYNDVNQRVQVRQEDGTYWLYEYDKLGQLTSGKRYWSDNTPVAGQQFEYAFDDIGNRTITKAGGDDAGAGLRSATYSANNLNQYTSRSVPGAADVIGIAYPTASVTANGATAYRKGEYFWKELSLGNTSAPLWTNISVVASLSGTNQTNSGYLFLPKATELYTYDADGNLTSDGRWTNRWDAENRLLEMESLTNAPAGSGVKMQFAYDHQSRRTSKVVSNWTGSVWQLGTNLHFLYDGWNLLAELNATNGLERTYLWGLDLSGSPQGAGGVGGLLAVSTFNSQLSTHFYAYDGNGNVRGMVDGRDGNPAARYDTGPFAESVRSSGAMAAANPMRFSTKYQDGDSDFLYYGYRFYNSQSGRWINRDPIEERGGRPLYAFVFNATISNYDSLGHTCAPLARRDLGIRPYYTNRTDVVHGETAPTWVMSPVIGRCFPGFSTCQYKVRINACWASASYWYDSEETRLHELDHVDRYAANWGNLLAVIEGFVDVCVSQQKAACYQSLISNYSNYYYLDAEAAAWEYDCTDRGGDPNSRICREATRLRGEADSASTSASATLARCSALP